MQNRQSNSFPYSPDTQSNATLLKKSQKLIQLAKQKRPIAPDKLKLMRHVFSTISNSQSSKILTSISSNELLI